MNGCVDQPLVGVVQRSRVPRGMHRKRLQPDVRKLGVRDLRQTAATPARWRSSAGTGTQAQDWTRLGAAVERQCFEIDPDVHVGELSGRGSCKRLVRFL